MCPLSVSCNDPTSQYEEVGDGPGWQWPTLGVLSAQKYIWVSRQQTLTMSCVLSIDKVNYNTLKVNLDIELVASTRNKTFETCSNALATFPTCNPLQLSVTLTLLLQSQLSLF